MMRKKSRPEDELIILDEKIDQVDRASAASRLASDGFEQLITPVLEGWLNNSHYILRGKAIRLLLGWRGEEKYIKKAVELLRKDPEWEVRCDAASSLTSSVIYFDKDEKRKDFVIKELLISLLNDQSEAVQQRVYEYIYKLVTKKSLFVESYRFNRNNGTDWQLLKPYLEKFNLSKPE